MLSRCMACELNVSDAWASSRPEVGPCLGLASFSRWGPFLCSQVWRGLNRCSLVLDTPLTSEEPIPMV